MKVDLLMLLALSVLSISTANVADMTPNEPPASCSKQCGCQVTCSNSNPLLEQCCLKNQETLTALGLIVDEVNQRLKNMSEKQNTDMSSHSVELKSLAQKVSALKTTIYGLGDIQGSLGSLHTKTESIQSSIDKLRHFPSNPTLVAKDCLDVYKRGQTTSGIYTIDPDSNGTFHVWCDMDSPGGGWVVFQRRKDGSVNFFREWEDYKTGFGNLDGEFWLGNDKIHRLTKAAANKIRIDLEDFGFYTAFAEYADFSIANESGLYKVTAKGYSGTSGNSFMDGVNFSTKDKDYDTHPASCAQAYKGGWWYSSCHASNLNGLYLKGKHKSYADGVEWYKFRGHYYSLKRTEMKIRRK